MLVHVYEYFFKKFPDHKILGGASCLTDGWEKKLKNYYGPAI